MSDKSGKLRFPSEYTDEVIGAFYEEARERITELERQLAQKDAEIARLRRELGQA